MSSSKRRDRSDWVVRRLNARRAVVPDRQVVSADEARKSDALSVVRRFGAAMLRQRRQHEPPWDGVARSVIYTIKRSRQPEAYSVASGEYNVIVISTGLLSMLELGAQVLGALNHLREKNRASPKIEAKAGKLLADVLTDLHRSCDLQQETDRLFDDLVNAEDSGRWAGAFLEFMILFVLEHEWAHITEGHLEL